MNFIYKNVSLIVIQMFSAVVCFAQTTTLLSGSIFGLDKGSQIKVESVSSRFIDSSTVGDNNHFNFQLPVEKGDIYFLNYSINGQAFVEAFYLQKGMNIYVVRKKDKNDFDYSGSALADEQNTFLHGVLSIYKKQSDLDGKVPTTSNSSTQKQLKVLSEDETKKEHDYYVKWVKEHNTSPFSVAVIYLYMQDMSASITKPLYNNLSEKAKVNNLITNLMPYHLAASNTDEHFEIGKLIKNFTLKDTSGNEETFSNLNKDSYVLIDIWASWCGPCRRSVPTIKTILTAYFNKNLKVVGISADDDVNLWKEAIRKDNMTWFQLCDLQGTDKGFMKDNFIFEYPTYLLVSPDGKIIAKPTTIERAEEELAEIFKKKS